jgi:hypothetical protein
MKEIFCEDCFYFEKIKCGCITYFICNHPLNLRNHPIYKKPKYKIESADILNKNNDCKNFLKKIKKGFFKR